jgi:type IV pilus assembly protein PilV
MSALPARIAKARQRGSFLLEALIAALIVALGILGLVGLQARAIQNVGDAQYRSEAAFLANDLLGRMWMSNQATLEADFETGAGVPYTDFKTLVEARLPGATLTAPTVTVAPRFGDPTMGYEVVITIFWQPPGDVQHNYQTGATVKLN